MPAETRTPSETRTPYAAYLLVMRDGEHVELPAADVFGFAQGWARAIGERHRLKLDPREATDTNRMRALMIGHRNGWWAYRYPIREDRK